MYVIYKNRKSLKRFSARMGIFNRFATRSHDLLLSHSELDVFTINESFQTNCGNLRSCAVFVFKRRKLFTCLIIMRFHC